MFKKISLAVVLLLMLAHMSYLYATGDSPIARERFFSVSGGYYDSTPGTLTTGDFDALRLTSAGLLRVSIAADELAGTSVSKVQGTAASGAAKSGNPVMVGGQDGTNAVTLLTTSTGSLMIGGNAASGAAKVGNPVLSGGQDGTNAVTFKTDAAGGQMVIGEGADGAAKTGNPVLVAGEDGTNAQTLSVNSSGYLNASAVGMAADGAAKSGNPVLVAGEDGTNAQTLGVNTSGHLKVYEATAATEDVNATVAADVDGAVGAATGLRLMGWAAKETSAGAVATFTIEHGATVAAGTAIIPVTLASNESRAEWYGPNGIAVANGLSIDHIAGALDVTLFYTTQP